MVESCHICGRDAFGFGYVEGAKIALCNACSCHATRFNLFDVYKPLAPVFKAREEKEEDLVVGFGARIKEAREKKGLSRDALGQKLLISEADLRAFEEERRKPLPDSAKKIEYALCITLVESKIAGEVKKQQNQQMGRGKELTLGDVIQIKKK